MNRGLLSLALAICIVLSITSCSTGKSEAEYQASAKQLIASRDRAGALTVLRAGLYRHPDSYGLNLLMGRTVLARYTDLTPHARSRYLARHYLKRAESLAANIAEAGAARQEYERVRHLQREGR